MLLGISSCHFECCRRDICSYGNRSRNVNENRNRDAAGTNTYFTKSRRRAPFQTLDRVFDEQLRFCSRYQDVRSCLDLQSVKFLHSGDALKWLPTPSTCKQRIEFGKLISRQLVLRVSVNESAIATEREHQEGYRFAVGIRDAALRENRF